MDRFRKWWNKKPETQEAPTEAPKEDKLETPWRTISTTRQGDKTQEMKKMLAELKPYDEDIPLFNVLLLGPSGHGKTSLINTIATIFSEDVDVVFPFLTAADSGDEQTVTIDFAACRPSTYINAKIFDTIGFTPNSEAYRADLQKIVMGHVKEGYKFDDRKSMDERKSKDKSEAAVDCYKETPTKADQVHAIILVLCANKLLVLEEVDKKVENPLRKTLDEIKTKNNKRGADGVPVYVVVTNIDQLGCPHIREKGYAPDAVHISYRVHDAVKRVKEITGVEMGRIFPIKNYESEIERTNNIDALVLSACISILKSANKTIEQQYKREKAVCS